MVEATSIFSEDYRVFKIPETQFSTFYPNSCSSGHLLKTIYQDETGMLLHIKLSHKAKTDSWGKESLNEIICCRLGLQLGLPVLQYDPCWVDLMNGGEKNFGCYSKSYLAEGDIPLTAIDICESEFGDYQTSASSLRKLGYSDLVDMFNVWDYLIGSTDRHASNIEFIMHRDGSITPAPIFDNGQSLLTTYAAHSKAWDVEQITNNFLTYQKTTNTFTSILEPVKMNPLHLLDWSLIAQGIKEMLSESEWNLIKAFIEHNYYALQERGLIR